MPCSLIPLSSNRFLKLSQLFIIDFHWMPCGWKLFRCQIQAKSGGYIFMVLPQCLHLVLQRPNRCIADIAFCRQIWISRSNYALIMVKRFVRVPRTPQIREFPEFVPFFITNDFFPRVSLSFVFINLNIVLHVFRNYVVHRAMYHLCTIVGHRLGHCF